MTWYRKNANGELVKTAGNIVQKINNGLLETTHEVIGGADYYTINPSAKKYITGLTDYTEFSLHISELNKTNTVYIRYNDKTLELKKTDNSAIDTESLLNKISVYTLDTSTGIIWIDYNDLTVAMNRINAIKSLIPKQASTDNQLADKDFVNSSISTSTATFRGTYTNIGDLSTIEADENDYIWFDNFDELGNRKFDKYKYSNGEWKYEYTLNNSSFTEAQWKALNSGITQELLNTILNNVNELLTITAELNNSKQDKLQYIGETESAVYINRELLMNKNIVFVDRGIGLQSMSSADPSTPKAIININDTKGIFIQQGSNEFVIKDGCVLSATKEGFSAPFIELRDGGNESFISVEKLRLQGDSTFEKAVTLKNKIMSYSNYGYTDGTAEINLVIDDCSELLEYIRGGNK